MQFRSNIRHILLLTILLGVVCLLAITLEGSEINSITQIEITGNKFLSEGQYIKFAQLENVENSSEMSTTLIRDRLEKHPYIKNIDVLMIERGIAKVKIYEKKIDAILLSNTKQFMITNNAEIIPLIVSTKNIDLPVIVSNRKENQTEIFGNAAKNEKLFCALKIISAAEVYDRQLYESISEINLDTGNNIFIQLTDFASPIYFGVGLEVEKTVFLSKVFKHLKGNKLTDYLKYVDLRFTDLVYLGLDEQLTTQKETI